MTLIYQAPGALPADEARRAKDYWAGLGVQPEYTWQTPWSKSVAGRVVGSKPRRVFEFGCNCGRNLVAIGRLDPSIELVGVDINAEAVHYGRVRHGLDLRIGDESFLRDCSDNEFDVVFTVSVIDHLADARPVLADLIRIARRAVLLVEPWIMKEGKVVEELDDRTGQRHQIESYIYSWDYKKLLAESAPNHRLTCEPYDLGRNGMRRWLSSNYWLFTVVPEPDGACGAPPLRTHGPDRRA